MAEGYVNIIPVMFSSLQKVEFISNIYHNIFIVRGYYNDTEFIQAIWNTNTKQITLANKLDGQSETTLFTVQGS